MKKRQQQQLREHPKGAKTFGWQYIFCMKYLDKIGYFVRKQETQGFISME